MEFSCPLLECSGDFVGMSQRVHVPKNLVLHGFRVMVIIVQVLGKYMIIRYLDPYKGIMDGPKPQTLLLCWCSKSPEPLTR